MPSDSILKAIHNLTQAVGSLTQDQTQERAELLSAIQQLRRLYGKLQRLSPT